MPPRLTNLALLVLMALALATGTVAFALGVRVAAWVVVAHGVVGLAFVVLAPWKQVIVRRGLRRPRPGVKGALGLMLLTVVTLIAGFAHSAGWRYLPGGITMMQVHVGTALALIPLAIWHVVSRPVALRRTDWSRRTALRSSALLGVTALGYAGSEQLYRLADLPGAGRRFTGSYENGSHRPAAMPITQWLFDPVPDVDVDAWRLSVANRTVGYGELRAFDDTVRAITDCTGGWWAEQDWSGVRLDRLVGDPAQAQSLLVTSVTGYQRRFPIRDLDRLWLATLIEGEPLSAGHGFPARIVAPGRRGFWWVKWVSEIRLDDRAWWAQPPFPLQ